MPGLLLRRWGSYSRAYLLETASGRLVRSRAASDQVADGFVKRCLYGKPILVFQQQDTWYLRVGKRQARLSDPERAVRFRRRGPFVSLRIDLHGQHTRHLYTQFMEEFVKFADPTYDRLDQECGDFLVWLKDRVDDERNA
ncbi:MAG: hypothetical protein GY708_10890 [Actinomycetia bacterium]|nr:hypothetical protein [Actinomycetes bacterium]